MKLAVIYHSETGNTKKAAEFVRAGMEKVEGVEARAFSIDAVDEAFVSEAGGFIFGAPTYYAFASWQMVQFLQTTKLPLADKLGAAFSTANFEQGGSEIVLENINDMLLAKGLLVFSGGVSHGMPMTHLGANAFAAGTSIEARQSVLEALGEKFAKKAVQLF